MFTSIILVFHQAVDRQCGNVTILDDTQREREEQFHLNLTLLLMNESNVRLNLTKITVTIIDNDCKWLYIIEYVFSSYLF